MAQLCICALALCLPLSAGARRISPTDRSGRKARIADTLGEEENELQQTWSPRTALDSSFLALPSYHPGVKPPVSTVSSSAFNRVNQYKKGDALWYWSSSMSKWYKIIVENKDMVKSQDVLEYVLEFKSVDGEAPLHRYVPLTVLAAKEQQGSLKKIARYEVGDRLSYRLARPFFAGSEETWSTLWVLRVGNDGKHDSVCCSFISKDTGSLNASGFAGRPFEMAIRLDVLEEKERDGELHKIGHEDVPQGYIKGEPCIWWGSRGKGNMDTLTGLVPKLFPAAEAMQHQTHHDSS